MKVTNFWDPEVFPADPEGKGEITQGKNLVDAKAEGAEFLIWSIGSLQRTDAGYIIPIPKFAPEDRQATTWVAHDVGPAALGMLKHSADSSKKLAAAIATSIKKPVTFVPVATAGMEEINEMFTFQAKNELYHDTPFPNPDLVELGFKFPTMEEFIQKEIVPRFA
ncbi:hypothetical protein C8R45DRAFT_1095869 [Mycena sanguinolenta]|nr:hypothetical protein C8R45DRAFT_1095869 [Mycena sanguinolenta]